MDNAKYTHFIESCRERYTPKDVESIEKAYALAFPCLQDRTRENGEPFIHHAIAVAEIVVNEIMLDADSATAVFLHEADRIQPLDPESLKKHFGVRTISMMESLTQISRIKLYLTELQAENFRKLLVSYSRDPRVVIIKLADRMEIMRSLSMFPKEKMESKAHETLLLYAPIAHKLGQYQLKTEFEDLSLRYIHPEIYRDIENKIKLNEPNRKRVTEEFIAPINKALTEQKFDFQFKSRTKSVYSVWRKMNKQGIPFEKVYDLFAIRVVINSPLDQEKADCWKVYSIVTENYTPDTARLRDWISVPKPNGYESLHTTVAFTENCHVEVQIRSHRMDINAERGSAAHWKYKGIKSTEDSTESWLNKIREALETPGTDTSEYAREFKTNEIFIYTPTGELRKLPLGASVLDYAFDIHTNLGCRCIGALLNGKNVSIREELHTGDTVEILTSKNQKPKSDWLSFTLTSKARTKIKQKLREEEAKTASIGREMLFRRLKNWKISLTDDQVIGTLNKAYKLKTATDLFIKIADNQIGFHDIKSTLLNGNEEKPVEKASYVERTVKTDDDFLVIDDGIFNVQYKFAKCCNPIFGDDIFGFITIGDGIKIHRTNCPNASRLISQYPYRIMKAQWRSGKESAAFQTGIRIIGEDEVGLSNRIMEVINGMNIPLRALQFEQKNGQLDGKIQVYINSAKQLEMLLFKLQQLKYVHKVSRISTDFNV